MNKPKPTTDTYYDYTECSEYLEKKYEYEERDYKNRYKEGKVNYDVEYCDFWHWVCDNHEVHNGCFIYFTRDDWCIDEETPDWVKEIHKYYIDEFADENGSLKLWVSW